MAAALVMISRSFLFELNFIRQLFWLIFFYDKQYWSIKNLEENDGTIATIKLTDMITTNTLFCIHFLKILRRKAVDDNCVPVIARGQLCLHMCTDHYYKSLCACESVRALMFYYDNCISKYPEGNYRSFCSCIKCIS